MAKSLCNVVPQGRVKGGGGFPRQILDKFKNRVNIDILGCFLGAFWAIKDL